MISAALSGVSAMHSRAGAISDRRRDLRAAVLKNFALRRFLKSANVCPSTATQALPVTSARRRLTQTGSRYNTDLAGLFDDSKDQRACTLATRSESSPVAVSTSSRFSF